ncbi:hypothetical protein B0H12DRAFT_1262 [Mycena haematopus]|nr:hypothetical protein B0H12DRAFT_1262 [Mycena haematopus]
MACQAGLCMAETFASLRLARPSHFRQRRVQPIPLPSRTRFFASAWSWRSWLIGIRTVEVLAKLPPSLIVSDISGKGLCPSCTVYVGPSLQGFLLDAAASVVDLVVGTRLGRATFTGFQPQILALPRPVICPNDTTTQHGGAQEAGELGRRLEDACVERKSPSGTQLSIHLRGSVICSITYLWNGAHVLDKLSTAIGMLSERPRQLLRSFSTHEILLMI